MQEYTRKFQLFKKSSGVKLPYIGASNKKKSFNIGL